MCYIARTIIYTFYMSSLSVLMYMTGHASGLCYYEKCHCPEGNERDLETPGSELLLKLQDLRQKRSMDNFGVIYSQGTENAK